MDLGVEDAEREGEEDTDIGEEEMLIGEEEGEEEESKEETGVTG